MADRYNESNDDDEPPKTGNVLAFDLIPCIGLCCCFFSCYTEFPTCLGKMNLINNNYYSFLHHIIITIKRYGMRRKYMLYQK